MNARHLVGDGEGGMIFGSDLVTGGMGDKAMLDSENSESTPAEVRTDTLTGEMRALAADVRTLLEGVHRREKYDFSTRAGWLSLLRATTSKRLADQLSEESLVRLRRLCLRWQRLYMELRFEASTRPVWNT